MYLIHRLILPIPPIWHSHNEKVKEQRRQPRETHASGPCRVACLARRAVCFKGGPAWVEVLPGPMTVQRQRWLAGHLPLAGGRTNSLHNHHVVWWFEMIVASHQGRLAQRRGARRGGARRSSAQRPTACWPGSEGRGRARGRRGRKGGRSAPGAPRAWPAHPAASPPEDGLLGLRTPTSLTAPLGARSAAVQTINHDAFVASNLHNSCLLPCAMGV